MNSKLFSADKGFAPLFAGHEPAMLLLHQSAYIYIYNNIDTLFVNSK